MGNAAISSRLTVLLCAGPFMTACSPAGSSTYDRLFSRLKTVVRLLLSWILPLSDSYHGKNLDSGESTIQPNTCIVKRISANMRANQILPACELRRKNRDLEENVYKRIHDHKIKRELCVCSHCEYHSALRLLAPTQIQSEYWTPRIQRRSQDA